MSGDYRSRKLTTKPHVRQQLKQVLDYLAQNRRAFTAETLTADLPDVDMTNAELLKELEANPKITCKKDQGTYAYQSAFPGVMNISSLERLLSENRRGILMEDLRDLYIGIEDDLETLVTNRKMMRVETEKKDAKRASGKQAVIYPRDMSNPITVDPDIKEIWDKVKLPEAERDVEIYLRDRQLLSEEDFKFGAIDKSRAQKVATKKEKPKRGQKRRLGNKITNKHMIGVEGFGFLPDTSKKQGS
jgi:hypothetical protein